MHVWVPFLGWFSRERDSRITWGSLQLAGSLRHRLCRQGHVTSLTGRSESKALAWAWHSRPRTASFGSPIPFFDPSLSLKAPLSLSTCSYWSATFCFSRSQRCPVLAVRRKPGLWLPDTGSYEAGEEAGAALRALRPAKEMPLSPKLRTPA